MAQEEVVGLGTYEIVHGYADEGKNLKIAIGLQYIFCFDFGRADA